MCAYTVRMDDSHILHDWFTISFSLAEWAHSFYAQARAHPRFVEATTGPGDLVFIPRGWWHSVVNLDSYTVALTHNFCSPRGA